VICQTQSAPGDFVPLLAQARRRYDAATRLGDLAMAAWYERFYNWLFEQRRKALLAQLAELTEPTQTTRPVG
jgi:hypothetical protein